MRREPPHPEPAGIFQTQSVVTVGASDLLALLINWGPVPSSNDDVLELLSRTGP